MRKACKYWAYAYFFVIMLGMPLYFENLYFNMLQAKSHFFIACAIPMLFTGAALYALTLIIEKKKRSGERKNIVISDSMDKTKMQPSHKKDHTGLFLDIAVGSFAITAFVSSALSVSFGESFLGQNGWGVGALSWLLLALSYFLLSRCFVYSNVIWIPVMAVNMFVIFIGILHAAGIDAFYMHNGIVESQIFDYYSTLGQMNWWVGYLCILIPLTMIAVFNTDSRRGNIIQYIFWVFLCFGVLISASDGIFVGLGFGAFVIVFAMTKSAMTMRKGSILIIIFGICAFAYSVLPCFSERISNINKGICKYMTMPQYALAVIAAGGILLIVSIAAGKKTNVLSIAKWVLVALLALTVVLFIADTVKNFSDDWGTGRGSIWRMSCEIFQKESVKTKVIGVGPEMLRYVYADISARFGMNVLASHSEPVQYLMTTGMIGLIYWIGIWGSAAMVFIKRKNYMFFAPLAAYLGQALVNSAMSTNLAILFIILALFRNTEK